MSEPSAESLALVDKADDEIPLGLIAVERADLALRIDAHVAERTAELRKIIHDQSEAHVAHIKGVDEANERRLDAYKARLDEQKNIAPAAERERCAKAAEATFQEPGWHPFYLSGRDAAAAAIRALPAEGDPPCHTG